MKNSYQPLRCARFVCFIVFAVFVSCRARHEIPLTEYSLGVIVPFEVEFTDEFGEWWDSLTAEEQASVFASVGLLEELGPRLGAPHTSAIHGSRHSHMRELRVQHGGRPYRVLYAFDPRRIAILLIGGDKTGDKRWYSWMIPVADRLYDEHLRSLR